MSPLAFCYPPISENHCGEPARSWDALEVVGFRLSAGGAESGPNHEGV